MRPNDFDLPVERVREAFSYSPKTGELRWAATQKASRVKRGAIAGSLQNRGYWLIVLDGKKYLAHRLAWVHFYGEWPENFLDHKNGVRTDNRIVNLRDVPQELNAQNQRRPQRNNKCGFLGVYPEGRKFAAAIRTGSELKYLGSHATAELAHEAYVNAKRQLHPGFQL